MVNTYSLTRNRDLSEQLFDIALLLWKNELYFTIFETHYKYCGV